MKYELLQIPKQDSSSIVNSFSIDRLTGNTERGIYCVAKYGILVLTKNAAMEDATVNIHTNAVCPEIIDTPMVEKMFKTSDLSRKNLARLKPIRRLGKGSEIADAVLWRCSPASSFIIEQSISVDGGYTIQ